jgi:hypothetical protein
VSFLEKFQENNPKSSLDSAVPPLSQLYEPLGQLGHERNQGTRQGTHHAVWSYAGQTDIPEVIQISSTNSSQKMTRDSKYTGRMAQVVKVPA